MLQLFLRALVVSACFAPRAHASDHALVLTNNRSLALGRPDLHYADDDGAKWTELFDALFGASHVTLLTELDASSAALFPALASRAAPPTRAALDRAVSALEADLRAEAGHGERTVVLVFAGHGDIADGEGFLELADARLTASDLEAIVKRLPAEKIHIVIDACNAYFMLYPRKPGGQRFTAPLATEGLLGRSPHVGAILSTSAEATAWEWSDIQSGLFSHVLRSGLRGAADVDHDGVVGYPELAGFLAIANAALSDPYRPRVFTRAPARAPNAALIRLGRAPRRAALELPSARRIAIRDARGVRLFDGHFEAGAAIPILLPLGELIVDELLTDHGTTRRATLALDASAVAIPLATLPSDTAERGEAQPFRELFATPFGPEAYQKWTAAPRHDEAPYGVSQRDAERLGHVLASAARIDGRDRVRGGVVTLTGAAMLGAMGAAAFTSDHGLSDSSAAIVGSAIFGSSAALLVTGVLTLAVPGDPEDLDAEFRRARLATEEERASVVERFEKKLRASAASRAHERQLTSVLQMVAGGLIVGVGIFSATRDGDFTTSHALISGCGALSLSMGLYNLAWGKTAIEETWDLYEQLRELPWEPGQGRPKVTIVPTLAPIEGGLLGGAAMTF